MNKNVLWGLVLAVVVAVFYADFKRDKRQQSELSSRIAQLEDRARNETKAKTEAKRLADLEPKLSYLHAILRPNAVGQWAIQSDVDHASHRMHAELPVQLVQGKDFLRIYFDKRYAKAGVIQVSTDDNFAGSIVASANLGRENATIQLRTFPRVKGTDKPINPASIWKYVPLSADGGNLWISITMVD